MKVETIHQLIWQRIEENTHRCVMRYKAEGRWQEKGPNVTGGYFHNPEKTAEAFTADGWFRTEDIGKFDDRGFLHITDRKKNLIKTAGGKYVAPQKIENMLQLAPLIEQACVIGDQRPYCIVLLVPEFATLARFARKRGISGDAIKDHFGKLVSATNDKLARYETIKRYFVLDAPFTVDNGMLTPTLKLRRKVIAEHYADQIEAFYAIERGESRQTL